MDAQIIPADIDYIGTALLACCLALQAAIKAAQLTKSTIFAGSDGRTDHPCRHRLPHIQLQVLWQPARCRRCLPAGLFSLPHPQ